MAYDNYENTPFDLNHNGHIDTNEAAYIYDSFFNEDNIDDADTSNVYSGGGYASHSSRNYERSDHANQVIENIRNGKLPSGKTMEELEKDVRRESLRKNCVCFALFMLAGGFIGGHLVTGIVVAALIIIVGFNIK